MFVSLVIAVDGSAFSMDVTLNVPGASVSGTLVDRNTWLKLLGDGVLAAGASEDVAEGFRTSFSIVPGRDGPWDDSLWVHLKDAKYLSGSEDGVADGALWRGRVAEVSGWSIRTPQSEAPQ